MEAPPSLTASSCTSASQCSLQSSLTSCNDPPLSLFSKRSPSFSTTASTARASLNDSFTTSSHTGNAYEEFRRSSVFLSSRKIVELDKLKSLTQPRRARLRQKLHQLYGRDQEQAWLQSCLDKATSTSKNQLVLIAGTSGTGKTALANSLKKAGHILLSPDQCTTTTTTSRTISLCNQTTGRYKGIIVSGKFELQQHFNTSTNININLNEPFHAIVLACREICRFILLALLPTNIERFKDIQSQLKSKLGRDIHLLIQLIPELKQIVTVQFDSASNSSTGSGSANAKGLSAPSENDSIDSDSDSEQASQQEASERKAKVHQLFRVFLRILSSFFVPMVIIVDDLQWADEASLELIQEVLLKDKQIRNLMLVGLYRTEDIDKSQCQQLTTVLSHLKDSSGDYNYDVTEITLGNLNPNDVKLVIMDLLSVDDDDDDDVDQDTSNQDHHKNSLRQLAGICHKRTQGNVFFLLQFIVMLESEELLEFDLFKSKYTWDLERIKQETGATSNLVNLMTQKMTMLPNEFGQLLAVAACLGSSFYQTNLQLVLQHMNSGPDHHHHHVDEMEKKLAQAVEEGFFERMDATTYRWAHDKIQEAAIALVMSAGGEEKDSKNFKFQIGNVLLAKLTAEELQSSLFLVANLLNEATSDKTLLGGDEAVQWKIAELNLQATTRAVSCSAFTSAAMYASKGIELLPAQKWETQPTLTLDLHSCVVMEAEEFLGNDENLQLYADEVLSQTTIPLKDKLRVYYAITMHMGNAGKHLEAQAMVLNVLAALGCKFPKSSPSRALAMVAGLLKMKATIKSRTAAEVAKLAVAKDPLHIETIKLLDRLGTLAYNTNSADLFVLSVLRSTQLTLQKGICEFSAPAFTGCAIILSGSMGDLQAGAQIGEYALMLQRRVKFRGTLSRTQWLVNNLVFPWTKPFQNLYTPLYEAYEIGMASGETESATSSICVYIVFSFLTGRPLQLVVSDCATYGQQMKDLKRQYIYDYTVIYWQAALNLMGPSENTSFIQGEVLTDVQPFLESEKDLPSQFMSFHTVHSRLLVTFGDHEECANLFLEHGSKWPVIAPGQPLYMEFLFCGGLSCFEMARQSRTSSTGGKKHKYRKCAKQALKIFKGWVQKGNPNVKHHYELLSAEMAALCGKRKSAERHYQSAISLASRSGLIHDAALSNERHGEFLALSDPDGATYYWKQALSLYSEWGAAKKVELLREKVKRTMQPLSSKGNENGSKAFASQRLF